MGDFVFAWQPAALALVFMLFDYLSGFAGAAKRGDIRSNKMREGLWHKAGFCGLILLAAIWEIGSAFLNIGIKDYGITIPELPAVDVVCVIVIGIEIVSILENLCELNPQIRTFAFMRKLQSHDSGSADLTVELTDEESKTVR